jgi:hypothetical protein
MKKRLAESIVVKKLLNTQKPGELRHDVEIDGKKGGKASAKAMEAVGNEKEARVSEKGEADEAERLELVMEQANDVKKKMDEKTDLGRVLLADQNNADAQEDAELKVDKQTEAFTSSSPVSPRSHDVALSFNGCRAHHEAAVRPKESQAYTPADEFTSWRLLGV